VEDLQHRQNGQPLAVIVIDLLNPVRSQEIVSALGPAYIDEFVRASSRLVRDAFADVATIYHVGVTTYAVVHDERQAGLWRETTDRLAATLEGELLCNGVPIAIDAVFGVSSYNPAIPISPAEALRTAVSAADDARAAELRQSAYNPSSDAANRRRFALLTDFRSALAGPGQLSLVYQPKIDGRTARCGGVEALLRWRHPVLGDVSPGEFIPLLEHTTLARPLTAWVVAAALRQVVAWRQAGLALCVSINVSTRNLEEPDFARRLLRRTLDAGALATWIEIEITEGALIRNTGKVMTQLQELREAGFDIAIDDFGSGYSNFSYLRDIPAGTVKLDQSFIRGIDASEKDQRLACSMIGIAHDLGLRVVAEGIETRASLDFLASCGCDEMQGYYICRPIGSEAVPVWLGRAHGSDADGIAALRSVA
jgi:EAL domain-containing protein (putative c-di-GMP-specific phosphodiesterase class I)/GGDEF domain-containing protein